MNVAVTTEWHEGVATVIASGDIDLASRSLLDHAVEAGVNTPGVTAVVLDIGAVPFLDSSGISALVRGRRLAEGAGVPYTVVNATGIVRQVLEMTGVWPLLAGEHVQPGPTT